MRQAVILAGGKGTRLAERLNGRPKPLIDVDGVPLLGRQLDLIERSGFDEAVILINHAADQLRDFCVNRASRLCITLLDDGEPRGTAGATMAALDKLRDRFLVCYGDTLLDVDLDRFWSTHRAGDFDATLFLHPNDHPYDSDLVELDETGLIRAFHSYPHDKTTMLPNLVNAALYVVEKRALLPWREIVAPFDFAHDLFPAMVESKCRLHGYISFEYIKDIGTPKRLDKAISHLRSGVVARARLETKQRAVFIDRDGTINQPRGHIASPDDLELIGDVAGAVRSLNEAEYRVILTTNQPVIARGEATFGDVRAIHAKLETLLGRGGAFLDRIEVCPHHPDAGFDGEIASLKIRCACRKPEIGLITRAQDALNIDLTKSWFIGDTTADMLAARRAGLRALLVRTGEAGGDGRYEVSPDLVFADLNEAAHFIVQHFATLQSVLQPLTAMVTPGDLIVLAGNPHHDNWPTAKTLGWTLEERGFSVAHRRLNGNLSLKAKLTTETMSNAVQVFIIDGGGLDELVRTNDRPVHRFRIGAQAVSNEEGLHADVSFDRPSPSLAADPPKPVYASGSASVAQMDLYLIKVRP